MTRRKNDAIQTLTGAETAFVADALRRGATRRELMGWLAAAGMTALTAGAVVTTTTQALGQTPKRGGKLRVAGFASSTTDPPDPPKGSNSPNYPRHPPFYTGLTVLDERGAPQLDL